MALSDRPSNLGPVPGAATNLRNLIVQLNHAHARVLEAPEALLATFVVEPEERESVMALAHEKTVDANSALKEIVAVEAVLEPQTRISLLAMALRHGFTSMRRLAVSVTLHSP